MQPSIAPSQASASLAFPEDFYNPGTLEFALQPVQDWEDPTEIMLSQPAPKNGKEEKCLPFLP